MLLWAIVIHCLVHHGPSV